MSELVKAEDAATAGAVMGFLTAMREGNEDAAWAIADEHGDYRDLFHCATAYLSGALTSLGRAGVDEDFVIRSVALSAARQLPR